CQKYSDSPYTF
nr:immunoglobulin light chain junction region [Macaca mulatta]